MQADELERGVLALVPAMVGYKRSFYNRLRGGGIVQGPFVLHRLYCYHASGS